MSTYYEMLELQPSASQTEVNDACEQLYLKWKGLVTHHDPATAAKANQAILQIETVRTTLTDPAKRSAYDQGIGLGGVTGGLVDLTSITRGLDNGIVVTPPNRTAAALAGTPAATNVHQPGLWACPKEGCGAENQPNTKFCLKCGTQLVRECPNCNKMTSLVATQRCGECGFSYEAATERHSLRGRVDQLKGEIEQLKQNKNGMMLQKEKSKTSWKAWIWSAVLLAVFGIIALASSPGAGLFLLLVAGGFAWAAVQFNPGRKWDPQIQSVNDQIQGVQEQIQRTQAAHEQLGQERF